MSVNAIFSFGLILMACCLPGVASAQDEVEPQVIRIKKESNLSKAIFDNTELRLQVMDRFGNPRDNRIASYKLWIKGTGSGAPYEGFTNALTSEMINALNKRDKATKIFFTNIMVKDDNDHLVQLPDVIEVWFPDCANCEKRSRRR